MAYDFGMPQTIVSLSNLIVESASSNDVCGGLYSAAIDAMRECPPPIAELAIRSAMISSPTYSAWIKSLYLDRLFPKVSFSSPER